MNSFSKLDSASTRDVLSALRTASEMTNEQVQEVLTNAFERIAILEDNWEELGRMFRWLHEHIGQNPPASDAQEQSPDAGRSD